MRHTSWLSYTKNRYLWMSISFLVWMLFFDSEDFITQYQLGQKINQLQKEKAYYIEQIALIKKEREELLSNEALLEKFAREKYFMKKPTEDVYILEPAAKK
jgi:cell division protein DivIC